MPRAAPKWIVRCGCALAVAWPLSIHGAVLLEAPQWGPRLTAIAGALGALLWAAAVRRWDAYAIVALLAAVLGGLALEAPNVLLAAPPILINAVLAFAFGASLLPGRDPFISRFARMEQGTLPADLDRYTRRLTWIWTALFAAMAATALALSLFGSLAAWSTFTNLVAYALVAALFVGEYAYRRLRYRNYRHATLLELVANVRSAGLFARK